MATIIYNDTQWHGNIATQWFLFWVPTCDWAWRYIYTLWQKPSKFHEVLILFTKVIAKKSPITSFLGECSRVRKPCQCSINPNTLNTLFRYDIHAPGVRSERSLIMKNSQFYAVDRMARYGVFIVAYDARTMYDLRCPASEWWVMNAWIMICTCMPTNCIHKNIRCAYVGVCLYVSYRHNFVFTVVGFVRFDDLMAT